MTGRLLFDPDCGFCTASAGWLARRGLGCVIEPMRVAMLDALGVDLTRAAREIPFVDELGRTTYGAQAIASALQTGSLPWRAVGWTIRLPLVSCLAASVYRWVAAHRYQLPGGTSACRMP